ncbi:MAG: reverse transcriptase domain-containing protein [Rickettsia endosymbiont of Ixodes persulcatus]|nr:reverse transcriptase domain-containing protein [Rickettsia endosymbiont of Ixodes persulcatus]
MNKNRSDLKKLTAGVPQGSILGPLLFDLYINDIVHIDDTVSYIIYADDTSLFFSGNDADQIIQKANQYLDTLNAWTILNL